MTMIEPRSAPNGAYDVSSSCLLSRLERGRAVLVMMLKTSDIDDAERLRLEHRVVSYMSCVTSLRNSDTEYPQAPYRIPARALQDTDVLLDYTKRRLLGTALQR